MIRFAGIAPHPPIMVPGIGKGESLDAVKESIQAMEKLGAFLAEADPKTIVLVTPHAHTESDAFCINVSEPLKGDFRRFSNDMELSFDNDIELIKHFQIHAQQQRIPLKLYKGELDHGTLVPMYYLQKKGLRLVQLSFSNKSPTEHFEYGQMLGKICEESPQSIAVLASGDLSHKSSKNSHLGYSPRGQEFDKTLVSLVEAGNIRGLLEMERDLVNQAGECGLRSISMLMGMVGKRALEYQKLSYQAPFGVGYFVANVSLGEKRPYADELGPACLSLARKAVELFVKDGVEAVAESDLPDDCFIERKGVFVTLKKNKELRGCIGTFLPVRPYIAQEIVRNAISACSKDPRFPPVKEDELSQIRYEVSLLHAPAPVSDPKSLDPKQDGIIVATSSGKQGLLLPDLEGITSVDQQIAIASQKGRIDLSKEKIFLYSFNTVKFAE